MQRVLIVDGDAEEESAQSRRHFGIHWAFDKTGGIGLGQRVVDHIRRDVVQRLTRDARGDSNGPDVVRG